MRLRTDANQHGAPDTGTIRYGYDVQGRVISETKTIASETYITSYGYDAAGNLRSITYPTGQTVQYVADTADPAKISGVKLNPAGANLPLASNITCLPFGPASNILLGNSVSIARGYDQNYRLSDVYQANGHTLMDQAYTLDDTGNVAAIADDLDPTRSKSFGYDALARLTGATGIYGTLAYTYDKAGNRLTETKPGSQDAYDYFPYTSRLRTVTGTHAELIAYDADGNITSRTPGAANPTPAVTSPSDYVYNAGGQRVMKTKNGATTVYHYDLEGRLIAETDDEGTLKQAYVWLNGEPLAMIASDGAVYYYHNDHLGTPQALTDHAVNLVWSADYLPFGQASVTTATVVNNNRFPGQVYDPETGFHYNWNRYYDPKLGRYITPDPIGLAGGINLYSYVQNNPVNLIDPYGLSSATYSSSTGTLTIFDGSGNVIGQYPAANNAQTGSRGAWAPGIYNYSYHTTHRNDSPDSAYGSYGNFVFNVPGCVGCGIHSGRKNTPDRRERTGPKHATNGCIRTTDEATQQMNQLILNGDALTTLKVQ